MVRIAVRYVYDPDLANEIAAVRPAHREYLATLVESGDLIASGPLATPEGEAAGALLILQGHDADAARTLLDPDPFWTQGFITERTFHEWDVVMGSL